MTARLALNVAYEMLVAAHGVDDVEEMLAQGDPRPRARRDARRDELAGLGIEVG